MFGRNRQAQGPHLGRAGRLQRCARGRRVTAGGSRAPFGTDRAAQSRGRGWLEADSPKAPSQPRPPRGPRAPQAPQLRRALPAAAPLRPAALRRRGPWARDGGGGRAGGGGSGGSGGLGAGGAGGGGGCGAAVPGAGPLGPPAAGEGEGAGESGPGRHPGQPGGRLRPGAGHGEARGGAGPSAGSLGSTRSSGATPPVGLRLSVQRQLARFLLLRGSSEPGGGGCPLGVGCRWRGCGVRLGAVCARGFSIASVRRSEILCTGEGWW